MTVSTNSLIGEITHAAMTNETSLATLLRMVKVAAFRLGLPELESWVSLELEGYANSDQVPEYRRIEGQVVALNPIHGWIPVGGNSATIAKIQNRSLVGSIAQLEAMVEEASYNGRGGTFTLHFPPNAASILLGDQAEYLTTVGTRHPVTMIYATLDRVRGKVLDWSIEMERLGVIGEGKTFSIQEQKAAQGMTNITFNGAIGTVAGNIGSGNTAGSVTTSGSNVIDAKSLVLELQRYVPQLIEAGANKNLTEVIENISSEISLKKPDKNRIFSFLEHAKSSLAGASGSLLATGALEMINKIREYVSAA